MGCLFDCFRARDEQSQSATDSVSQPSRVESRIGHDSKNRLSALFLSEEKADSSPCDDREVSGLDSKHIEKDLKDEAQFLKACGTTPIEIRKAAEKLETPQRGKQFGSSKSHDSWISSNSDAVFHLDEKSDEPCEEFSEQTPSSCLTDAGNSARISAGFSDAGEESQESIGTSFRDGVDRTGKVPLKAGKITGRKKSVRFELDFDQSYSSTSSKNSITKIPEKASKTSISEASHNPTSLKLSDEIQPPVTIFPANMEPEARGRPRIRSQFVHSPSTLTEDSSPCKLPEDSDESLEQSEVQVCKEKTETESPTSVTCGEKLEESSDDKHEMGETGISPRVKQSKEKSNTNKEALSTITHGDRPIIGMVAAHWNEEEPSQISPKWWDGNGIPNSTNKYKEDQKVNWHATSFEERLEKALSEESSQGFVPPRKLRVMEEAERDTAISQMHHSAQSKSIVSF